MIKIGQGLDIHAFTDGDFVMLGGVKIAHTRALMAHSDGDVVLHALSDALLGALALGDIGMHFSDQDPEFLNIDSKVITQSIYQKIKTHGYQLGNADITIICEAPKIAPHRESMQKSIADMLDVMPNQISIKATTNEKLGALGRAEGIFVSAIVLLQKTLP